MDYLHLIIVEVKESKIAYKTYLGNWEYETNIATVYSK